MSERDRAVREEAKRVQEQARDARTLGEFRVSADRLRVAAGAFNAVLADIKRSGDLEPEVELGADGIRVVQVKLKVP